MSNDKVKEFHIDETTEQHILRIMQQAINNEIQLLKNDLTDRDNAMNTRIDEVIEVQEEHFKSFWKEITEVKNLVRARIPGMKQTDDTPPKRKRTTTPKRITGDRDIDRVLTEKKLTSLVFPKDDVELALDTDDVGTTALLIKVKDGKFLKNWTDLNGDYYREGFKWSKDARAWVLVL